MTTEPAQRGLVAACFDQLLGWHSGLPSEQNSYTKQAVKIPLEGEEHVELVADLYRPVTGDGAPAAGTILVQSPYGRRAPLSVFLARVWAARGHNVLFVSVRGTFGSGGPGLFDPARTDKADGPRVVRWMRKQPWYTGTFATFGMSFLGYTQYALMGSDEPLEDHVAAVISVGPHDFSDAIWGTGSLWLPFVDWAKNGAEMETQSPWAQLYAMLTADANGALAAKKTLPLTDGVKSLLGPESHAYEWLEKWLVTDWEGIQADPEKVWEPTKHARVLDTTKVPVLLLSGAQDIFTRQTMQQYQRLRERGCTVALTFGAWNHVQVPNGEGVMKESWDWMEKYLSKRATGDIRPAPVRIQITGSDEWRWMPSWPPHTTPLELYLDVDSRLATDRSEKTDHAQFTFDPHDPTPTFGGPLLFSGGYVDDSALAKRADVLSFTTPPLDHDVETMGKPHVELLHSSDNQHVDLFVRLCEVNSKGASRNLCEVYKRLDPDRAKPGQSVRIELDLTDCAHRFTKGTAVRLIVAGGNFPHYAVNLGSGENQGTGTTLRPSTHTVHTGGSNGSKLILPVS